MPKKKYLHKQTKKEKKEKKKKKIDQIKEKEELTIKNNDNNNQTNDQETKNQEDEPTWTPTIAFGTLATLSAGATLAMKFALDTKIGTIVGGVFAGAFGVAAVITGIWTYNKKSEIDNGESQTSLDENNEQNQEAAPTVA